MVRGKSAARGGGAPRSSLTGVRRRASSVGAGSADGAGPANSSVVSGRSTGGGGACALTQCGSCSASVGEDGIGCDRCDGWFHPVTMCMGLPDKVIETIVKEEGKGILFVCLKCRINHPTAKGPKRASDVGSDLTETIKQLHEMVISLCTVVRSLMTSTPSQVNAQPVLRPQVSSAVSTDDLDLRIREQIREVRERDIRRDSVIVRGLPNSDVSSAGNVFQEASRFLINKEITLEDPVCISREKGIFRGKVPNMEDRKCLLAASPNLKQSDRFPSLYIHRDLTYRQRQELRARRAAANREQAPAGESRSSETPQPRTLASFLPR